MTGLKAIWEEFKHILIRIGFFLRTGHLHPSLRFPYGIPRVKVEEQDER